MLTHAKRTFAAAALIAAAATPSAAIAQPNANLAPSGSFAAAAAPVASVSASPSDGFQWGDAGIGAAGTVLLLGAGVAGSGAHRRRRTHRVAG